jgi:hypothetical protein
MGIGLHHVLERMLETSIHQGMTKYAALAKDTVNIRGVWNFDMGTLFTVPPIFRICRISMCGSCDAGWGCGYRNALMALSSILLSSPSYRPLFARDTNGSDPGVRRAQGWLQEAWGGGWDAEGKAHFKGKVLGTRKWIGTSGERFGFAREGQC